MTSSHWPAPGIAAIAPELLAKLDALLAQDQREELLRTFLAESKGAVESGLFYGYLAMVEGLVARMTAELGGTATCIATGGLASIIVPETHVFAATEPDITLYGLKLIWERNRS